MRKFFIVLLIAFFGSSSFAFAALPPIEQSIAFIKYKKRIKTELSKLIFLLDRFNVPDMEIKIDGNTFKAEQAFPFAKAFLAINYRKQKADVWLQKYCYRSPFTNQIMLACMKDEECIPGRDLLLNELTKLREFEQSLNGKHS